MTLRLVNAITRPRKGLGNTKGGMGFISDAIRFRAEGNGYLSRGPPSRAAAEDAAGAYRQALACLDAAALEGPDVEPAGAPGEVQELRVALLSNLAQAALVCGEHAAALEAADAALALAPAHAKALFRRARALAGFGAARASDAVEAARAFAAVAPGPEADALLVAVGGEPLVGVAGASAAAAPRSTDMAAVSGSSADGVGASATPPPPPPPPPAVRARRSGGRGDGGRSDGDQLLRAAGRAMIRQRGGLYADAPGYDEPLEPLEALHPRSWAAWLSLAASCGGCRCRTLRRWVGLSRDE